MVIVDIYTYLRNATDNVSSGIDVGFNYKKSKKTFFKKSNLV